MPKFSWRDVQRINTKTFLAVLGTFLAFTLCVCAGAFSSVFLLTQPPAPAPLLAQQPAANDTLEPTTTSAVATATATATATRGVTPTASVTATRPAATAAPAGSAPSAATPTRAATTSAPVAPTNTPRPIVATPTQAPPSPPPAVNITYNWKGKLPDPPSPIALPMGSPEYGMQAFLWWLQETRDRDIELVKAAGFSWIKQNFAWRDIEQTKGQYDWSRADRIVLAMNDAGMDLIVRVDFQPAWARSGCSHQGPPSNYQDYYNFLRVMANRYKGRIRAYEIWNEPNLSREWCDQPPNAAEYTRLLKGAYETIKAIDPNAWIVSAGLSPTTRNDNVARPDVYFLREMYQAGAGRYFDLLGVHGAGWRAAPEADPAQVAKDPNLANPGDFAAGIPEELRRIYCFRHVEDLRAIMAQNGDAKKQVAILEFGWTSDQVHADYKWFAVTEEQKADYFVRAYKYAYDNWSPWIGLMSLIYVSDPQWTQQSEEYWWAITNPDGSPRPAYNRVKAMPKPIKTQ